MKSPVAIAKCNSYEQSEVSSALSRALEDLGGVKIFIKPGQKVFLKLNLLGGFVPENAVTTHPSVVKAVIEQVRQAGGIPAMGDSPGGSPKNVEAIFHKTGMRKLSSETGCPLINLSLSKAVLIDLPSRFLSQVPIAGEIIESDVVISIAKLKTHTLTTYTGIMKNMFGSVPGNFKSEFHRRAKTGKDMSELLTDLYGRIKPDLAIMDGVIGMEGDGPSAGTPRKIGFIGISADGVSLDAVSAKIVNLRMEDIFMIRFASEKNIGEGSIADIPLAGDPIDELTLHDFRPPSSSALNRFVDNAYWEATYSWRPVVTPELCKTCHLCEESCPANAIVIRHKLPEFDYEKCIRCFSCQEFCPEHAIQLKPRKYTYYKLVIASVITSFYNRLKGIAKQWKRYF